ncbi:MAG: hypothetical protein ACK5LV_03655 [Lachnospirales bacterium]
MFFKKKTNKLSPKEKLHKITFPNLGFSPTYTLEQCKSITTTHTIIYFDDNSNRLTYTNSTDSKDKLYIAYKKIVSCDIVIESSEEHDNITNLGLCSVNTNYSIVDRITIKIGLSHSSKNEVNIDLVFAPMKDDSSAYKLTMNFANKSKELIDSIILNNTLKI